MATTIPSAALVPVAPVFTTTERLALAGFLAGYSGLTRQAHADPRTRCAATGPGPSLDRHATYIVAAYIAGAAR